MVRIIPAPRRGSTRHFGCAPGGAFAGPGAEHLYKWMQGAEFSIITRYLTVSAILILETVYPGYIIELTKISLGATWIT